MSRGGDEQWWRHTTVYQIYPRSFADANGDGIGDLEGIIGHLDYLQRLGVETLWLSPFFASPQADFGYDITDYYDVAPEYGTRADVERLIREVHARGMKIVLDLVLNHTSDEHPWFLESRRDRRNPKRDYYLWRPGRRPRGKAPPNNWRSMLGGSGWHYDAATEEWYFASFLPFQPDLNHRNPAVKAAMLDVARHWLAQGVDGFRLDIFNTLYKDASFADNPWSPRPIPTADNPHGFFQRHARTIDQDDTFAFARELRRVVDGAGSPPRFVVGEVFGEARALRRYCGAGHDGLHLVFLFQTLHARCAAAPVRRLIDALERAFPDPFLPTWVLGNHDRPRLSCRLGGSADEAKLMATLQLTVRGVPFIYYGDEIGMEQLDIPRAQAKDPVARRFHFVPRPLARLLARQGILTNRDECRAPMQWDAGPNAGFSPPSARPWLPIHPRYRQVNVAAEERVPSSLLHCYRALLRLRREQPALHAGRLALVEADLPRDVVAYRRVHGEDEVAVFLNFSSRPRRLALPRRSGRALFSSREVAIEPCPPARTLAPHEGIVIFGPRA